MGAPNTSGDTCETIKHDSQEFVESPMKPSIEYRSSGTDTKVTDSTPGIAAVSDDKEIQNGDSHYALNSEEYTKPLSGAVSNISIVNSDLTQLDSNTAQNLVLDEYKRSNSSLDTEKLSPYVEDTSSCSVSLASCPATLTIPPNDEDTLHNLKSVEHSESLASYSAHQFLSQSGSVAHRHINVGHKSVLDESLMSSTSRDTESLNLEPKLGYTFPGPTASGQPLAYSISGESRDRDPLRLSRFLSFPNQVGERGADVYLFDGLINRNSHDIRLLRSGYYGIRLHNQNEVAWDSLYLGIGKMKVVAEFEVIPPPGDLKECFTSSSDKVNNDVEEIKKLLCESNKVGSAIRSGIGLNKHLKNDYPIVSDTENNNNNSLIGDNGIKQIDDSSVTDDSSIVDNIIKRPKDVDTDHVDTVPVKTFSDNNKDLKHISDMLDNNNNLRPTTTDSMESDMTTSTDPLSLIAGKSEELMTEGLSLCKGTQSSLIRSSASESVEVVSGLGQLIAKAQEDKVILTFGMRLKCRYDLIYCGPPRVIPSNPLVPFLRPPSILCLDGGGVLGISSLKILERIELEIQKELNNPEVRLRDCFDMICGTSTGGIISLGLLTGLSIKEMINMWAAMSGRIFGGNRTLFSGIFFEGYDVAHLKKALAENLGQRFINTYTYPYCFVTSTNVKHNPYELFLLRNYTHHHLASNEHRGTSAVPVWTAAWSTSAAPTYLKGPTPQELERMGFIIDPEVQLCDGAMKANNPTMVALEEAARLTGKRLQHFIQSDLDLLVSIGTGQPTLKQTMENTGIVSTFQILVNSAHLLTSATSVHREVLHWLDDYEDRYFRFNVPGIGDIPLDSCNKNSYDIILKATNDYLTDEKYYDVKRLVKKLASRVRK